MMIPIWFDPWLIMPQISSRVRSYPDGNFVYVASIGSDQQVAVIQGLPMVYGDCRSIALDDDLAKVRGGLQSLVRCRDVVK